MITRNAYPTDLTDAQWQLLEPLIPPAKPGGRPCKYAKREILNGIFYLLRTGCSWRMLPHDVPPGRSVYHYLRLWQMDGTRPKINQVFRLLWTGNIFNNMALWLQLITLGWQVWELTKDPGTGQGPALLPGMVAGLRAIPTLVIGPWTLEIGSCPAHFDSAKDQRTLVWSTSPRCRRNIAASSRPDRVKTRR